MRYEDIPNARIEFNCGPVETLRGLNIVRRFNKILLHEVMPPSAWQRLGKYCWDGLVLSNPMTYRHPSTNEISEPQE